MYAFLGSKIGWPNDFLCSYFRLNMFLGVLVFLKVLWHFSDFFSKAFHRLLKWYPTTTIGLHFKDFKLNSFKPRYKPITNIYLNEEETTFIGCATALNMFYWMCYSPKYVLLDVLQPACQARLSLSFFLDNMNG